jgi:2-polyprenyl-3-methyl-5-hydroxy-6-metoxy-1,4-benzoquinol methylase
MEACHSDTIARGERFPFGANWRSFLSGLNDYRIAEAENSLKSMLSVSNLSGKSFLDIGCGSGLFSLAARRLGAEVYSFDYDPQSVACTHELKRRFFQDDKLWTIQEGSALDERYINNIGQFDVVYSWGVLHHTGNMMQGLRNAQKPVKQGGSLFIAIYNDQGLASRFWTIVKKTYCSGAFGRHAISAIFIPAFALTSMVLGLVKYGNPVGHFTNYKRKRGMSLYHDWIDWLGGYPFEVAKPETIFLFYQALGFRLLNLRTTNRLGCNQFVFERMRL